MRCDASVQTGPFSPGKCIEEVAVRVLSLQQSEMGELDTPHAIRCTHTLSHVRSSLTLSASLFLLPFLSPHLTSSPLLCSQRAKRPRKCPSSPTTAAAANKKRSERQYIPTCFRVEWKKNRLSLLTLPLSLCLSSSPLIASQHPRFSNPRAVAQDAVCHLSPLHAPARPPDPLPPGKKAHSSEEQLQQLEYGAAGEHEA